MPPPSTTASEAARHPTVVHAIRRRAKEQPERIAFRYLLDGEVESHKLTYQDLDAKADQLARTLLETLAPGDRALLLFPAGVEFIHAFIACLYAGIIAVPTNPPKPGRGFDRVAGIASDAGARIILTTQKQADLGGTALNDFARSVGARIVVVDDRVPAPSGAQLPPCASDQVAFLQYTSGSTGSPKGVVVTHANITANVLMIERAFEFTPDSMMVSWLPTFHDMGLIGATLNPLYIGCGLVQMPPVAFLEKPLRWLKAITAYKATHAGGPNFAFDLLTRKTASKDLDGLNLDTLHVLFNGAEPVREETLKKFTETFAAVGFHADAFRPCYGLAEATLIVAGSPANSGWRTLRLDPTALEGGRVVPTSSPDAKTLVGCGRSNLQERLFIVDPASGVFAKPGHVGEIWISGANIGSGYWQSPETTRSAFESRLADGSIGRYLRTGDLGFVHEGELYICGRIKDVVIIGGRNLYPQDIELIVESAHPSLRASASAAFSIDDDGSESLVIVAEIERGALRGEKTPIVEAIVTNVVKELDVQPASVILLKPGAIPKTSSGKIRRSEVRRLLLEQTLNPQHAWVSPKAPPSHRNLIAGVIAPKSDRNAGSAPGNAGTFPSAAELHAWLPEYAKTRINSRLFDERRTFPPHIVLDFGNRGLLGMFIPKAYGGPGHSLIEGMGLLQRLAAIDLSLATFVGLNNGLGVYPILRYGDERARQHWLPRLAAGRELAAFALTEDGAGSNPLAMHTTATPDAGGSIVLRGKKKWIGSGAWAGVITTLAKEYSPSGELVGVSAFLVEQGAKGLTHGPEALTLGMRGMIQNEIWFDNVAVQSRLGERGLGFSVGAGTMAFARVGISVIAAGGMKRAIQLAHRYASRRAINTGRLLDNSLLRARLSENVIKTRLLDAFLAKTLRVLDDSGDLPEHLSLSCKILAPEWLWECIDTCLQAVGGRGYTENNPFPQMLRDARIFRIFEGPTETLAYHLGSIAAHKDAEQGRVLHAFLAASTGESAKISKAASDIGQTARDGGEGRARSARELHDLGALTAYGILQRMVASEFSPASPEGQWLSIQIEGLLQGLKALALGATPESRVNLEEQVIEFTHAIGDFEQHVSEPEAMLDAFFRVGLDSSNAMQAPQIVETPPISVRKQTEKPVRSEAIANRGAGKASNGKGSRQAERSTNGAADHRDVRQMRRPNSRQHQNDTTQPDAIAQRLRQWFADNLQVPIDGITADQALATIGLDSVMAVELRLFAEEWLGVRLPESAAWEYPTIAQLADFLAQLASKSESGR